MIAENKTPIISARPWWFIERFSLSGQRCTQLVCLIRVLIQSGEKTRNILIIAFLIFIFIKLNYIIYQIYHNLINFMMVKTVYKNILQ